MESLSALLRRFDLQPSRGLGQHFLTDDRVLRRIVAAAEVDRSDTVLEIGAGLGHLTAQLAEAAGQVVAVEVDRRLAGPLQERLAGYNNVCLVMGDILELDPATLMGGQPYKVVANLPYAITSAVLRHLLEADRPPERMVVTVQREVAERIVARGGRMSLLAVSVQFYGRPQLLFRLKPGLFSPPPEVESAAVRIDRHACPPIEVSDVSTFFRIVRAGFSQPRKQLRNSLAASLGLEPAAVVAALERAGIEPHQRAERLTLADWSRLTSVLA